MSARTGFFDQLLDAVGRRADHHAVAGNIGENNRSRTERFHGLGELKRRQATAMRPAIDC